MTTETIEWHDIKEDGLPDIDETDYRENHFLVVVHHRYVAFDRTIQDDVFVHEASVLCGEFVDDECDSIETKRNGHTFTITQWAKMPKGVHK